MQQNPKSLADHLNSILDGLEVPTLVRERVSILSKILHITKQEARAILEGHVYPDDALLEKLATELEVNKNDLIG